MIIGVVSDIHGRLSNEAYEALSGSDYILCAGDIENRMVLTELETIAPTICVRGNLRPLRSGSAREADRFAVSGWRALSYGASSGRHRHGAR